VVVDVDGVDVVLGVDWVVVVDVVELGAAATPAIPVTAPAVARAPTTIPARIMPALFIREPPMVGEGYPTILRPLPKPSRTAT
jgi:hypothetical protein